MDTIIWYLIGLFMFLAWATHVIICITKGMWVLLVIGVVVFPVAVVHGAANWFGLL